jgi:DNA ligase (NAD+)
MTRKEYDKLIEDLKVYSDAYYIEGQSLISDYEFDQLMKLAEKTEEEHPDWKREDSPTSKVGSDLGGLKTLKHKRPMLSLQNTYNQDEVKKWFDEMTVAGVKEIIVEYKYDGVSFSATYENGKIVKGLTRGDGEVGEDITENIKLIDDLNNISEDFTGEVRGEIIMEKTEFERLNVDGKYANPRNLASGTIKLLDQEKFKQRKLRAFTYWLEDSPFKTHKESLDYMKEMGFNVGKYYTAKNFNTLWDHILTIENDKKYIDYDIDGAVLKVNETTLWPQIGGTSKFPHWAKAYKYEPESVVTRVKDIEFWVGRTGKITPVAILEPVFLSGSTVQKATLNNKGYMEAMDIQIGDNVSIKKAAEIIPFINHVIKEDRLTDGQTRTIVKFPTTCPDCGTKLVKHNEDHADFYCDNDKCGSKIVGSIVHFTNHMEIDGFAEIVVERLHKAGLLNSVVDLYKLKDHREEMIKLDRFGEKLVDRLLKNIENSKEQKLEKFLSALGIRNVGRTLSKQLAKKFKDIKVLMGAEKDELYQIDDVGDIVAEAIHSWFKNPENRKMLKDLEDLGVRPKNIEEHEKPQIDLSGKNFCITGALSLVREKYIELIEMCGGKVVSSVSSKTHYLITNDKTTGTSKNKKAKELGIPILNEIELLEMCDALHLLKILFLIMFCSRYHNT